MNTKRSARVFLFFVIGLLVINLIGGVLAAGDATGTTATEAGENAGEAVGLIGTFLKSFLGVLFGDTAFGNESLSRFFVAMLIAMFVYTALESFFEGQSPYIKWGATIAATALAIIGFPDGFLESIRTGYGVMGATIVSVIPFLIIFWFSIKTKSLILAKITWAFYSVYYLFVFASMFIGGSDLYYFFIEKTVDGVTTTTINPTYVYLVAFVIGAVIFISIGHWRNLFFHGELQSEIEKSKMSVHARAAGLRAEAERLEATTGIRQGRVS